MNDLVIHHARLVACDGDDPAQACAVRDGWLAVQGDRIAAIGDGEPPKATRTIDAQGALLTPGLIDCHTHLVYAGDRAREFELRLQGASYEEIARAGGGIVSTVRQVREAGDDALFEASAPRLRQSIAHGVTTIEIKSGYGLTIADELKLLRVARRLGAELPIDVRTTLLAAHALPPEYAGRADVYVDEVAVPAVRAAQAAGLADAVDAFCETIGFDPAQTRRVFEAARAAGLPVKLHAEQLSNQNGAALVAEFGGQSADHLEHLDDAGVAAMARAGTVAVLLPGAYYFLRDTRLPPIEALRRHGVPMAVATDCNPGTSPTTHLPLMLNMACTLFRLTPAEALLGVTRHAAKALGLADRGALVPGLRADLCLWEAAHPAALAHAIGASPLRLRIRGGTPTASTGS